MIVKQTSLAGVVVVESQSFSDPRGFLMRLFCEKELSVFWGERKVVQINQSRTKSVGAVRGMHFQHPPYAEMKLVRCLRGKVWDVAVDLRGGSPTFLKWHAEELTPGNAKMMVIPEGCAHGFQVLEENSELLYLHTASYTPLAEGGVSYGDPKLDIRWPLPVNDLSLRDLAHAPITPDFSGIVV
jgi:dTDP-4-dehydrorhamnose 3,5-epimerase